jgi:integral membrane protein
LPVELSFAPAVRSIQGFGTHNPYSRIVSMTNLVSTPLGRLRAIGFIEGISFLLLLGVAMPLKYVAGMPEAVRVVGMAHGILWLLFIASVAEVRSTRSWPHVRTMWAVLSSVVPFGTFVLDTHLRQEQSLAAASVPLPDQEAGVLR